MDILELFPIDFELAPSARGRLREAAGGELAVVPLESLTLKRRREFSQSLGQALVDERSAMRLEDALPGLSTLAIPLLQQWDIPDRLRSVFARHGVRTAADLARFSLDEIGLWVNVGREFQRKTAVAAVEALSRGALEQGLKQLAMRCGSACTKGRPSAAGLERPKQSERLLR